MNEKLIPLINTNEFVIIDDVDFPYIERFGPFYKNRDGYALTNKEPHVLLHNLLLPTKPGFEVDHKNRIKLDCRRDNLRYSTPSQNKANKWLQSNNTTGYKGVYLEKRTGKWFAKIQVNKKAICLGTFDTPERAAYAYDRAALQHFKEFACLNFPSIPLDLEEDRQ